MAAALLMLLVAPEPSHGAVSPAATNQLTLLEAVRQTLYLDPVIKLQGEAVTFARGRVREEQGQFDAQLKSDLFHELNHQARPLNDKGTSFQRFKNQATTFRVGVDQPLRNGITMGPGLEVTRVDETDLIADPQNRGEVNFSVVVPLARGLGRRAATALERAAIIERDAARLDLEHTTALRILNTTIAYWNYRAAARRQLILVDSENRANSLFLSTSNLVNAQEVPAAELDQIRANLSGKSRSRIAADQGLFESRQQLGLAMGLSYNGIDALPATADEFPKYDDDDRELPSYLTVSSLYLQAAERRADLKSARLREDAASALLYLARNGIKPQVDLTLQVGYEGFDSGHGIDSAASSFTEEVEGVNAFAAISFNWPVRNNAAHGRVTQQRAVFDQAVIRSADLSRTIRSSVAIALHRVRSVRSELEKALQATLSYQQAVTNEKEKQRLGLSSFTDVLLVEDRLTGAELDYLQAVVDYANAVVQLRFQSGLLLKDDPTGRSVTLETLTALPPEITILPTNNAP